jgi:hypothetical protein
MTDTRHLTDEQLILHFYGESDDTEASDTHLASCGACREELGRLQRTLSVLDRVDPFSPEEAPGPAFEREVWARLEPQLAGTQRSWLPSWLTPRAWLLAGGIAVLLVATFVAGRISNGVVPAADSTADGTIAERVLVVAVVDHLDRTQMVLLEVMNADVESAGQLRAEQAMARELVAANRLYRQTAEQTGDGSTGDVLDELERVLLEIANTPDDTRAELDALRARIASRGLLFKVRVVHSEMRERERQAVSGSQS